MPEEVKPTVGQNMEEEAIVKSIGMFPTKVYTIEEATKRIDGLERLLRAVIERLNAVDGQRFVLNAANNEFGYVIQTTDIK